MAIYIPPASKKSFAQKLSEGVGRGLEQGGEMLQQYQQKQQQAQQNEAIKERFGIDLSGISSPEERKAIISAKLAESGKSNLMGQKQQMFKDVFGGGQQRQDQQQMQQPDQQQIEPQNPQEMGRKGFDPTKVSDEQITQLAMIDPNAARAIQHAKDVALRENRENKTAENKKFETERAYHTQFSKKAEEEVEATRSNLSKKEMSLNLSRDAVESGEVGAFSLANLAQRLNLPEWQTMKGAQLETAIKENLLSNMTRVSAKGQNLWFDKKLNSMMAQIGKSEEANLAAQEILEGEVAMDRAYVENFDRLAEEDMKQHQFVKKDVSRRAHDAAKSSEKQIFKRTNYRLKELEEQEKGLKSVQAQVGKNVDPGTPLTMAMAKLYKNKFGDEAIKVAKKNGYYIPTIEEYQTFRASPQEFREEM
jgi:hypothetical protein